MDRKYALALAILLAIPIGLGGAAATHEDPGSYPACCPPPGPWPTQTGWPPTATGRVHFMLLNGRTAPEPSPSPTSTFFNVTGSGAIVMVNVTDTSLTESTTTVTVTSTSDIQGEELTLHRRMENGFAVYHGFLGFETSLVAGNGQIFVRDRDRVQVVYRDHFNALSQPSTSQDSLTWYAMRDGTIATDQTTYVGLAAAAQVTVQDRVVPDSQPQFMVKAVSDTDRDGIVFPLNHVTDGNYRGVLGFGLGASTTSPPTIQVKGGDQVRITYATTGKDQRGHDEEPQTSFRWEARTTAVLQIMSRDYKTVLPAGYAHQTTSQDAIFVRLEDPDLIGRGNATVNLFSTGSPAFEVDPTGINVRLTETGPATGEFLGRAGFIFGAPSTSNQLRVTPGASVTARYVDAQDANGAQVQVQSQAVMWTTNTATATLTIRDNTFQSIRTTVNPRWVSPVEADACRNVTSVLVGCHPFVDRLFIEVRDGDLMGSPIQVRVTSTRDPLGVNVTLFPSDLDGVPGFEAYRTVDPITGQPRGVGFNFTHSNQTEPHPHRGPTAFIPTIWLPCSSASATESVTVTYIDPVDAEGRKRLISQTVNAVSTGCATSTPPAPTAATVHLKFLQFGSEVTRLPADFTSGIFTVELRDPQSNRDTGAAETNRRFLVVASNSDQAQWTGTAWNDVEHITPPNVNLSMVEVNPATGLSSPNTGVFRGSVSLSSSGGGGSVRVGPGDNVCAYWLHQNQTHRNTALVQKCIPVDVPVPVVRRTNDSFIAFRDRMHQGGNVSFFDGFETAYIWLMDNDRSADISNTTADTAFVIVRSNSDLVGINVTLRERYAHHRMAHPSSVCYGGATTPCTPGATRDDGAFLGSFRFSKTASSDAQDILKVADGDIVTAYYRDPATFSSTGIGRPGTFSVSARWNESATGTLSIDGSLYRMDRDGDLRARVTVVDRDHDTTAFAEGSGGSAGPPVVVNIRNERSLNATTLNLVETAGRSGVFTGLLPFNPEERPCLLGGLPCPNQILVKDEDFFTVRYEDRNNANGQRVNVTVKAQWFDINAARVTLDAARYSTESATATVTVDDRDRDTSALVDQIIVQATSDSDNGVRLTLNETGARTGIFAGTFGFERNDTSGNQRLFVRDGDRVRVHYIDREINGDGKEIESEFRHKTAHALWRASTNQPPTTTLVSVPAASGSGRILIDPGNQVNFTVTIADADGTVATWRLDYGNGVSDSGTGAVNAARYTHRFSGASVVTLSAVDNEGGQSSQSVQVALRGVDDDAPANITDLTARDVRTTRLTLDWTAPENNANARDGRAPTTYDVRMDDSPIVTLNDFRAASVLVSQVVFDPIPLAEPGERQTIEITGLVANTTYHFAVAAKDAGGNAGGFDTVTARTAGADTTPPTAPRISSSHPINQPRAVNTVTFNWTAVTDDSPVRYVFILDGERDTEIRTAADGLPTTGTSFVFNGIADDTYHFHLAACSDGGCSTTAHYGPVIVQLVAPPTLQEIENANKAVRLVVVRDGNDNIVDWALPNDPSIIGVQIWRSTSPFDLIATFDEDDTEFQNTLFVDRDAPKDARYLVTVFYGRQASLGFSSGASDDVPGFEELSPASVDLGESNLPVWFWILLGVGVVVIILLFVGLALALRRRPEDSVEAGKPELAWAPPQEEEAETSWGNLEADEEYAVAGSQAPPEAAFEPEEPVAAPAPPPAPKAPEPDPNLHHLTCPACQAEFTASGPKPLVTECPSCGVRGILR